MAGKKKEGIGSLKETTGGSRRDDRLIISKYTFEEISINTKNALTVIYMLKSPEDSVVLRAVASLENYGGRAEENLRHLASLGIFQFIFPLTHHNNTVIKRFSQKLIGMLCSLEEFRDEMFKVDNILNFFLDILEKETDMVMYEFSALTLAELTKECEGAANLLKVPNCIPTLFVRILSPDPDVRKNCLEIIKHLLNDVNGIETFIESPKFDINSILTLVLSSYPVIQFLALEVLQQLVSWCRDTRVLIAFKEASGIELVLSVVENEEWKDLHVAALDLLISVVDSPELCDYFLHSGCLQRIVNLLYTVAGALFEKILAALARMSQHPPSRVALHKVDMIKKFCLYLNAGVEIVLEASCLALANMAQYHPCLESILIENPMPKLLDILISDEYNLNLRNLAALALNVLANEDKRATEIISNLEKFDGLSNILAYNENYPLTLSVNVLQIFLGIATYPNLRAEVVDDVVIDAFLICIQDDSSRSPSEPELQKCALECLSIYLLEKRAQFIFISLDGARKIISALKSNFAIVREWGGQVVIVASQNKEFVKSFIKYKGLQWLIDQKSTRFSMPSWESAIEMIFSAFLPAKFAYTGRLDFQDITEDGFFVASRPLLKFTLLEEYVEKFISPTSPIYVANFEMANTTSSSQSGEEISIKSSFSDPQENTGANVAESNLSKSTKGGDKWTGSLNTYISLDYEERGSVKSQFLQDFTRLFPDPYLGEYLENLRKRLVVNEFKYEDTNWFCIHPKLVRERARIIAELVAEEMSGPEPNPLSISFFTQKYINEMKYQLGTSIFPLGYIRMGNYLERALLFKVLSDKVGFPCALVRGSHGRAWVEIAVPVLNAEDPIEEDLVFESSEMKPDRNDRKFSFRGTPRTAGFHSQSYTSTTEDDIFWFTKLQMECFKAFPTNFLKPNAIVDLIDVPGRILKLNSLKAEEYCGDHLFAKRRIDP